MKRIFLTGVTGIMGWAGFQELLKRKERFHVVLLVRPSKSNRKRLAPYEAEEGVTIVWGDLTNYADVLRCVTGADYVLHVGGMVSPKADYLPKTTMQVNVGAAENIVKAVKAQPNADDIKVVYIGSVAQASDRNPPVHWGRTGDPVCISVYDHYAISKTIAEKTIAESGIRHWVSLRQSGILYAGILRNYDPIMFHVPIKGVLEWATVEDSGRLLANVCEEWVGQDFWNRFYNIGSGASYRLTNYQFEQLLLKTISCPPPEKIFNANWFVLRNFHGMWYADSDLLESYLRFRENIPCEEYFERMKQYIPWYYSLAKIVPAPLIKYLGMMPLAYRKGMGTMDWIRSKEPNRISAFYGTIEEWKRIPSWETFDTTPPTKEVTHLDHGYDESKPDATLSIGDMQQAAHYRGGECLSKQMAEGDLHTKLRWRCQFGHEFEASPLLILKGGHWCPECLPPAWNYDKIAKGNPFFAQVWYANHTPDEDNHYDASIYEGWEK